MDKKKEEVSLLKLHYKNYERIQDIWIALERITGQLTKISYDFQKHMRTKCPHKEPFKIIK